MARTVIGPNGTVDYSDGSGVTIESGVTINSTVTMNALPTSAVQAKTTNFTASNPGVYTVTAGGAVGCKMPLASSVPGGLFVFRNGDAYANFLTGSAEAGGTYVFTDGTTKGSKLTLLNVAGASVALVSDGKNFLVTGNSGSLTFAL